MKTAHLTSSPPSRFARRESGRDRIRPLFPGSLLGEQSEENNLIARQLSARGGKMSCEIKGSRVILSGNAVTFMTGEIDVPLSSDLGGGNLS